MKKFVFGIVGVLAAAGAANGQVWVEIPDAPNFPNRGQNTVGVGPLLAITGLGQFDAAGLIDPDVYCVRLVGGAWSANTFGTVPAWDTMIALWDGAGNQIAFNDDNPFPLSGISGNNPAGQYFIGVTRFADTGFDDTGGNGTSPYRIDMQGFTFCEVPTPGAAALLGVGGLLALRRRR